MSGARLAAVPRVLRYFGVVVQGPPGDGAGFAVCVSELDSFFAFLGVDSLTG